jgi:hypothetical protein
MYVYIYIHISPSKTENFDDKNEINGGMYICIQICTNVNTCIYINIHIYIKLYIYLY